MHCISFQTSSDEDTPLLNTLGILLFWTQFGLGLGLFVCLVIAVGLLIWCQQKNKHRPASREDPEQPQRNPGPEPKQDGDRCTERQLVISHPINHLNSVRDEADANSEVESIYNEPLDESDTNSDYKNPFEGWIAPSSFRPIGPPPPPPAEHIPMVVRPVAKRDKSTMTDPRKSSKGTLPTAKGLTEARSDIKSGYMASPDSSPERSDFRAADARPKQLQTSSAKRSQHFVGQAQDECPTYNLPPLPVRSSSMRHKKREGRVKTPNTANTMC